MSENIKTLLFLNPVAGKGKGKDIFKRERANLGQRLKHLDVKISTHSGHSFEIGKNAVTEDYKLILSIGGDGTFFEIVNGVYASGIPVSDIEFGIIPAGTGNSFYKDLDKISQDQLVERVLKKESRKVDLIKFNYFKGNKRVNKYFINMMGVGLIADITKLTNEKMKFLGTIGYSLAVVLIMFRRIKNRIYVKIDNKEYEFINGALIISNSRYAGGNMKVAPMAEIDDGKVDVIVFNEVNRRETIDIFINVFRGAHIDHKKVKVFKGSNIEIESDPQLLLMADGEVLGETPLKLTVLPIELKIKA